MDFNTQVLNTFWPNQTLTTLYKLKYKLQKIKFVVEKLHIFALCDIRSFVLVINNT